MIARWEIKANKLFKLINKLYLQCITYPSIVYFCIAGSRSEVLLRGPLHAKAVRLFGSRQFPQRQVAIDLRTQLQLKFFIGTSLQRNIFVARTEKRDYLKFSVRKQPTSMLLFC